MMQPSLVIRWHSRGVVITLANLATEAAHKYMCAHKNLHDTHGDHRMDNRVAHSFTGDSFSTPRFACDRNHCSDWCSGECRLSTAIRTGIHSFNANEY